MYSTKQEKNLKGKGKIMHIFGTLVRLKGKGIETSYTELPLMSQPLVRDLALVDRMCEACDPLQIVVSH